MKNTQPTTQHRSSILSLKYVRVGVGCVLYSDWATAENVWRIYEGEDSSWKEKSMDFVPDFLRRSFERS